MAPQLATTVNRVTGGDGSKPEGLTMGAEALAAWLDIVSRTVPEIVGGQDTATAEQFSEWGEKFDEAGRYIALAALCWSTYVSSGRPASDT